MKKPHQSCNEDGAGKVRRFKEAKKRFLRMLRIYFVCDKDDCCENIKTRYSNVS